MAPVLEQIRVAGAWLGGGGDPLPDAFVSGLDAEGNVRATQPTIPTWENTGHSGTLTTYTGTGAGGTLNVTTAGATYENLDFGNTRVSVSAPNVTFRNCRWLVTDCSGDGYSTAQVDFRSSGNTGGGLVENCTVENVAQNIRGRTGIMGWNVRIERTRVRGFVDGMGFYVPGSPGTGGLPLGVLVLDSIVDDVAWTYDTATGIVHQSDDVSHSDPIQTQGGSGLRLVNAVLRGRFSTTVGTGTPNSGSNTGWPGLPYTQAEGEAQRYAVVSGGGTYATPGTRGYQLGGSISGLMVNTSTSKGQVLGYELAWVYGSGGAYWLNSAGTTIGDWGTITHLRIVDDQRITSSGLGVAVAITPGTAVTMTDAYYAADDVTWESTGTVITRRNT